MKYEQYIEADDYYDMAVEWIKQRNYDKAIECLEHTIALNSLFIYAYIELAEVYARKDEYHEAIKILKNAARTDPSFDRLFYLAAKYAFIEEDYKNALVNIKRAIEINPDEMYLDKQDIIEDFFRTQRR